MDGEWEMDPSFVSEAQRALLQRRAELAHRARRTEIDLQHEHEPLVADFADQATQRGNEDVLREIGASAREQLRQVNRALQRIEAGNYLNCAGCGAAIGEARLRAVPEAELCVPCAAKQG